MPLDQGEVWHKHMLLELSLTMQHTWTVQTYKNCLPRSERLIEITWIKRLERRKNVAWCSSSIRRSGQTLHRHPTWSDSTTGEDESPGSCRECHEVKQRVLAISWGRHRIHETVRHQKVETAVRKIKEGKATRPDSMAIEVVKNNGHLIPYITLSR